jgi:hypothetical protein
LPSRGEDDDDQNVDVLVALLCLAAILMAFLASGALR